MKIIEATEKNIPEIVELWKELADHHSNIDSFFTRRKDGHVNFKSFITELIKSEEAKIFIAIEDQKIIGYIITNEESGKKLIWDGLELDGFLDAGMELYIFYLYS